MIGVQERTMSQDPSYTGIKPGNSELIYHHLLPLPILESSCHADSDKRCNSNSEVIK